MIDRIKELSNQYLSGAIGWRRHLHANPELSFREHNTSEYVQRILKEAGIPFKNGVAGTGIVAFIEGRNASQKRIALRADMDALPILEENEVSYKSRNEGVMHACGHDVHTASLLGAAHILNSIKDELEGTVQLVFQPGEEVLPGGASVMINEGIFREKLPAAIYGQHVFPELPAGKVGFKPGMFMASCDEIYMVVKGKGGHAAKPDNCIDPVLIASHIIVALQQVVSRWSNTQIPTVLSFGKVTAAGATNIIPNEVKLEGTFRTFNEEWRKEAHLRMKELAKGLASGMGGSVDFCIDIGYPVLYNHVDLTAHARQKAIEYLGEENVVDLQLRTTSEDFAYYTHLMPGCFYRLGTAGSNNTLNAPVHNPKFDVDERSLETGMGLLAWQALNGKAFS